DRAAERPLATFRLPIRNVTAGVRESDFYVPGAILRIRLDPNNPVALGMPTEAAAFFIDSPAFAIGARSNQSSDASGIARSATLPGIHIVAEYPSTDLLMSGWILGERLIAGHAAAIAAKIGRAHV